NRPVYEYRWREQPMGDQSLVTVEIVQTQTNADVFEMPIDIAIETNNSQLTAVGWQKSRSQTFEFRVTGEAKRVELDPRDWILKRVKQPDRAPIEAELSCPEFFANRLLRPDGLP